MTPISIPEVVWEVWDNIMHFVSELHLLLIPGPDGGTGPRKAL